MRTFRLTLTTKTLLRLTIASFCISLFITSIEMASHKNEAYHLAHATAVDKVNSVVPALRSMLWGIDTNGIHNVLNGLTKTGAIVGAELVGFEKILISLQTSVKREGITETPDLSWSIPIMIDEKPIAELRITESYEDVREQLSERMNRLVSVELLKASCLGVLLFFIVYRTITRHLIRLVDGISKLRSSAPEDRIDLEKRSLSTAGEPDELDALVDGINRFHRERAQEIKRRKQVEAGLEVHINDRTQALTIALQQAEKANLAKSTFLSNMSHELRTPLNAILGFAQLMENDEGLTTSNQQRVKTINRAGRHLLSLINSVLEISRIEAGRVDLQTEAFDLKDALLTIEELIQLRTEEKGLSFRVEYEGNLPPYVMGDADRLRQILINLLGNAAKYTDQGEISLKVVSKNNNIHFEVADTGPGISKEDQTRLFQSFYQTSVGIAKGEGTGLGLTISREYVRLMGGELSVESDTGQGCIFSFTLNLPPCEAPAQEAQQGAVIGLVSEGEAPRVLVVEDNKDSRELMTQILQQAGFEVRTAENGQLAIDCFQQWRPQFIWMDMRMPVLNGYEATRAIRALQGGGTTKIVALTASAFEEDRAEIIGAGCNDMLKKPMQAKQIFAMMERLLKIEFRYAGEALSSDYSQPLNLSALPLELCGELQHAAEMLDMEGAQAIVEQTRQFTPDIACRLERLLAEFQFGQIVALCQNVSKTQRTLDDTGDHLAADPLT